MILLSVGLYFDLNSMFPGMGNDISGEDVFGIFEKLSGGGDDVIGESMSSPTNDLCATTRITYARIRFATV